MDVLFTFIGALCPVEGIDLFTGSDFLTFVGSAKEKDYDLKRVFQMEKWASLVDVACSFGVGFNRFPDGVEAVLLVMFGAALATHVYMFKGKKLRKEK